MYISNSQEWCDRDAEIPCKACVESLNARSIKLHRGLLKGGAL